MDLQKLLAMQEKLDATIFKNSGITEYPINEIRLALLVELGELCNEIKCFKYWKKNKGINKERALDEFADCLHFALSLQNNLKLSILDFKYIENTNKIYNLFFSSKVDEFVLTNTFNSTYRRLANEDYSATPLSMILVIGLYLGFTGEEMEQAYLAKNKVNYERQKTGY